jgi:hypothetical protein
MPGVWRSKAGKPARISPPVITGFKLPAPARSLAMAFGPAWEPSMSTIPKTPAPNRRAFLTRALAGAAGATIAVGPSHAALPPVADDPVLDLIAEAKRWNRLGGDARERADEAFFAASDELQRSSGVEKVDLPAPFRALYAEAKRCDDAEQELFDRIVATRPTTIEGAAAKLELLIIDPQDEVRIIAADLRALAGGGVA